MLKRVRVWLEKQQWKAEAIRRATKEFQILYGAMPMGAYVLHIGVHESIVRVMYITNHIPPSRIWFAVPNNNGKVRELTFNEVCKFEKPWR